MKKRSIGGLVIGSILMLLFAFFLSACGSEGGASKLVVANAATAMSIGSMQQSAVATEVVSSASQETPQPNLLQDKVYSCPPEGQFALMGGLIPVATTEALLFEFIFCDGALQMHNNVGPDVLFDMMFIPGNGGGYSYYGSSRDGGGRYKITPQASLSGSFTNDNKVTYLTCAVNDIDIDVQAVQFACTAE